MTTLLRLDYETRSCADIGLGGYEYSLDPSTRALCVAWQENDTGPIRTHRFNPDGPQTQPLPPGFPDPVTAHVHAFNVAFEQAIWRHVLHWPEPAAWSCTMALCAVNGLPQSLAKASKHLGFEGKHEAGFKVMKRACAPDKKTGEFPPLTDQDWSDLLAYCAQDVEMEAAIAAKVGDFPTVELPVWSVCNTVNNRGVLIDRDLCEAAVALVERIGLTCDEEVRKATGGAVTGDDLTRVQFLTDWINSRGVAIEELTATSIAGALRRKELPADVRTVLLARQKIARASVKKLDAALRMTKHGGRLRGQFRYCAAGTGRWKSQGEETFAGKEGDGVQLQNLVKPPKGMTAVHVAEAVGAALRHDLAALASAGGGQVDGALASLVRPAIIAPRGKLLAVVDYASIEARGALWLANDLRHLRWFTDYDQGKAADPYCLMAGKTFGRTITKADKVERAVGKEQMLASQYGMGPEKFGSRCEAYGIDLAQAGITPEQAIADYRAEFTSLAGRKDPDTGRFVGEPGFWKQLERGALEAFRSGRHVQVGPLTFAKGRFGDLAMRLPSGRIVRYHSPRIAPGRFGGDQLQFTDLRKNSPQDMYGGKWLENATQAVCRDLLAYAMVELDRAGFVIVMHCHDEVVCEVESEADLVSMGAVMRAGPVWSQGFPIAVEGFVTTRYGKEAFPVLANATRA